MSSDTPPGRRHLGPKKSLHIESMLAGKLLHIDCHGSSLSVELYERWIRAALEKCYFKPNKNYFYFRFSITQLAAWRLLQVPLRVNEASAFAFDVLDGFALADYDVDLPDDVIVVHTERGYVLLTGLSIIGLPTGGFV